MPSKPPPPPLPPIVLHLRPLPDSVPTVVRLRRALKVLLRAFGLQCVRVIVVPAEDAEAGERPT